MTHKRFRLGAVSIALLFFAACGGGGGDDNNPPVARPIPPPMAGTIGDGRLEELLEWARASQDVPAMAMVLVQQGQIAEMAAIGRRSVSADTPVTVEDRWHIGSLTKAMTATLAGVLIEQSVISWETTPFDVWPELDPTIHPGFRNVTLKQLLSHTSGMRNLGQIPSSMEDDAPGTLMEKRRAWAAELLTEAPAVAAGTFLYSNSGYVVAGAMLETLTATPWETLLAQQVFAPLGMQDSGFGAPGTPGEIDAPWGHWDRGAQFDPVPPGPGADNPQAIGPAGTVHCTLTDYAQFMLAHIAGARGIPGLLTVPTFETLHTPLHEGSALGWGVDPFEDWAQGMVLAHAGSNVRWYAVVRLAPALDAGVFFVVNAGENRANAAIAALTDLILERLEASR